MSSKSLSKSLRIIFAGTPAFAEAHLAALLESRHQVVAVLTQPDRPTGRGKQLLAGPVKRLALDHDIPVHQPPSLKDDDARSLIESFNADIMVVVAYGLLLPPSILSIPPLGCINVHASLLPRWRGAAPIERAILAGDTVTGVCIMQMDAGLDTGPVLNCATTDIVPEDNSASLTERLTAMGQELLVSTLDQLPAGTLKAQPQDEQHSTYAAKLKKEEALIQWSSSASEVLLQVRAFYPRSPAFTHLEGERLRILDAEVVSTHKQQDVRPAAPGEILKASPKGIDVACGKDVLRITLLQLPGRNPVAIGPLLNAHKTQFRPGRQFDNGPAHA